MEGQKQLLVDVSVTARSDAGTGVQRVVRGILRQLLLAPPAGYAVVPVRAGRWLGYRYASEYSAKLGLGEQGTPSRGKVRVNAGDVFLALDLTSNILPRHHAQLASWKRSGVQVFFFVHDMLPLFHPDWFTAKGARNYARWIKCLAEYADGAICTTRTVADQLRSWLSSGNAQGARDISIMTVPLGSDVGASVPSTGLPPDFDRLLAQLRSGTVVLMVGTIEPRKGHEQALSAFEILWRQGRPVHLVIVGSEGWKAEHLFQRLRLHPENGKRLVWLRGASDEALCLLYAAANGVLLASQAEGFGLPLVEAARYGKPILARDIAVYRDIAGDHASFFSGDDPDSLASALLAWLEAIGLGAAPASSNIRTSTWAESAHRISESVLRLKRNA
jgi:glycosyltransferase involved in cell wall biosynthesis